MHAGVTCFCDTLEAPFTERGTLIEQAKAIDALGMRAIVSLESSERVDAENGERCLQENVDAVQWTRKHAKRVQGAICTHTTFTCSKDFIARAGALAEENDAMLQFHLSESVYEPSVTENPALVYRDLGVLGERTLASQCVQMTEPELLALRDTGTKVVHMPLSNCEVGGGFSPVPKMLEMGKGPGR